ncbi:MAG: glucosamine-6-phosphate deaminase [Verrucomicrobiota bacterium]
MNVSVHPSADASNVAAAECLTEWLTRPDTRTVMVAAGNTPLELYRRVAEKGLNLGHLTVFALDEYVGVPRTEPRNCANLLRRSVAEAWGIPADRFHTVSSEAHDALQSIRAHEKRIAHAGGLDVLILGLGQNGHLGFNEPGSDPTSGGRVLDLESVSIEANRKWFGGDYAPAHGVTVGMDTILAARRILILAHGPHKTEAVAAMLRGPIHPPCPASYLRTHSAVSVFLDSAAAGNAVPA